MVIISKEMALEEHSNYIKELEESMQKKAETSRTNIAADIRKMINNPEYSDVAFRCKDGARVHASRLFLVARSEVLHRMLLNGMAESQLSEITLHEVSSIALLPTLEFLYTGTLQEHAPKDWKKAYEIIAAARFFLLGALESIVMDHLHLAVAKVEGDVEAAAKLLSITVEYVAVLGKTVDFIARDLVCALERISFEPRHLQVLTGDAFLYFLRATVNGELELEFQRLRNIILWCACKEYPPQAPLALSWALHTLPHEIISMLRLYRESPALFREEQSHGRFETCKKIQSRLANSIKQYMHLVDLRRIPSDVLVNIVEPMDIASSNDLLDAFRFQALQRDCTRDSVCFGMGMSSWSISSENQNIYRMGRGGSFITRILRHIAPGIGFVRYGLPLNQSMIDGGLYEWEITIERVCDAFIEIGLLQGSKFKSNPKAGCSLSEQPGGWALRMDPQGVFISRYAKKYRYDHKVPTFAPYGKDCSKLVYGEHYGHRNSKIKVCFNMSLGKCSFIIDGEDFGEAWDCMTGVTTFPAVSLGTGSGGQVRIRIIRMRAICFA